jgi:twitching motility two-component system response regulator PilH
MSTPDEITASSSTTNIAPPATTSHVTRGTILVVEDDRAIRRYLEVILERKGYNVVSAADGLEAMKAALTHDLDAVVTDAIMPHLSGLELCRFLRNHPKLSRLPVVLLSGFESATAAHETNDRPDVYLAKPVRPDELDNCLTSLLLKAA